MRAWLITMLLVLGCSVAIFGQTQSTTIASNTSQSGINWMSWQEATADQEAHTKKILLFIYTDWCSYSRKMEEGPFQDPSLSAYINEHFIPVKLNASTRETLTYESREYNYVRKGNVGYHELAALFLDGRMSFPSIVILDTEMEVIQTVPGYQSPVQLERIATYFGQNYYQGTPWSAFQRTFQPQLTSDD